MSREKEKGFASFNDDGRVRGADIIHDGATKAQPAFRGRNGFQRYKQARNRDGGRQIYRCCKRSVQYSCPKGLAYTPRVAPFFCLVLPVRPGAHVTELHDPSAFRQKWRYSHLHSWHVWTSTWSTVTVRWPMMEIALSEMRIRSRA